VVSTFAGQAGSAGSADGSGSAARFNGPEGVACDAAGTVYVADAGNFTIRRIGPDGQVSTLAGEAGSSGSADGIGSAARFAFPTGVACDADGNVFVADRENCTIRRVTPAGVVTTVAGKAGSWGSRDGHASAARFNGPEGIACDAAGNLFVAEFGNSTIRKITPAGRVTTVAGKAGSTGSADGTGSAARFNGPMGIACDAAGNLYVADHNNNMIRKITRGGDVSTLAGQAGTWGIAGGGGAAARFNGPSDLVYVVGNLYVTDYETVRRITPAGVVTSIAGKASSLGSDDGRGTAARFNGPYGIAGDAAGRLYVADSDNNTIRKLVWSR
jgi:sugar lactone lactonase YvrE